MFPRRKASQLGARATGAAGPKAWRGAATILSAGRQTGPDQASALRPPVQACQQELTQAQTYLGRVIRDIGRRIADDDALQELFARELNLARRVLAEAERGGLDAGHIRIVPGAGTRADTLFRHSRARPAPV